MKGNPVRKILMLALLIGGCSNTKNSETDIRAALNNYLAEIHSGCIEFSGTLPATLEDAKKSTKTALELEAYVSAGLIMVLTKGNIKQYVLTPEGQRHYIEVDTQSIGLTVKTVKHGAMCLGTVLVDNLQVTSSSNDNAVVVSYTYKIEKLASWADDVTTQSRLPQVNAFIHGQHKNLLKNRLAKTVNGWSVIDTRVK